MQPNEPFDYDRLDALLREIGYEDPEEAASPAQPKQPETPVQAAPVQPPSPPPQPRTQATAQTCPQTPAQQQTRQQQLYEQFYGHPKYNPYKKRTAQPSAQQAPRPVQQQPQTQQPVRQQAPQPVQQPVARPAPQPAAQQAPPQKRRRKRSAWKIVLLVVLLLIVLAAAAVVILLQSDLAQPVSGDALGARKSGCSTILLAGTDAGGTRTDTIMLCTIDTKEERISLLSIPRDTLVNDSYAVPKINGTYGVYGGGEDGMEALMDAVQNLVGFRPDGYVLVDLDAFVEIVDLMGGVEFDVPMDMNYSDPAQSLTINLTKGLQTLNGEQAMGLVRFRSGYALADLERVNVQRDFISACMDQWVTPGLALKAKDLLAVVTENVTTDLTSANLAWCAGAILRCDTAQIETNTLPGYAATWNGGSYYIIHPYDTVELVNEYYNPYIVDVTIYDLDVRTP